MERDNRCTIPFEGSFLLRLHVGSMTPCCKIRERPLKNSILTDIVPELRQAVLNNERHTECMQCWRQEDSGQLSYRQLNSKHLSNREVWDNKWSTLSLYQPVDSITLIFSNKCQLMCVYCDPSTSSMWEDTGDRFIKFKNKFTSDIESYDIDKLKTLIDITKLKTIIISGGEPMLGKECIRFLQELEPSSDRTITIITNLSYGNSTMNTLLSILQRHGNTCVAASLDSIGENISRKYLNWELWNSNFKCLISDMIERRKTYSNARLIVIITVSILNYDKVQPIIEYILDFRKQGIEGISFNINPLRDGNICSLFSGETDPDKCVNLDKSYSMYLTPKEFLMIENLNRLIKDDRKRDELEKNTDEFLLEYLK
jgi:uncharacterized Fe-S cluster-containing radical SAM superfamily protein